MPILAAQPDKPFVIGQIGQSLDGRVATLSGDSCPIGGSAALDHLHLLRAHVDAVLVGAATLQADNPQLTVRRVKGQDPARIVLDAKREKNLAVIDGKPAKWLLNDGNPRILVTADKSDSGPAPDCDEVIRIKPDAGSLPPAEIIRQLFARGYGKILIEGGPATLSRFLQAGCIDRLHIVISPLIIGSGKHAFDLEPIDQLAQAVRPDATCYMLGAGEVLFDCDMRTG